MPLAPICTDYPHAVARRVVRVEGNRVKDPLAARRGLHGAQPVAHCQLVHVAAQQVDRVERFFGKHALALPDPPLHQHPVVVQPADEAAPYTVITSRAFCPFTSDTLTMLGRWLNAPLPVSAVHTRRWLFGEKC